MKTNNVDSFSHRVYHAVWNTTKVQMQERNVVLNKYSSANMTKTTKSAANSNVANT
jgi:hypothetical protein